MSCEIDENVGRILGAICEDCVASKGGCKHCVALLMWLHRRSEEPSPTSVVSYWEKPKLGRVGSNIKFILAKDIGSSDQQLPQPSNTSSCAPQVFKEFTEYCSKQGIYTQIGRYVSTGDYEHLSIHTLFSEFKIINEKADRTYKNFKKFCTEKMGDVHEVVGTHEQSNSSVWYEMRYGRITASIIHAASKCKTPDGSLVELIFGAKLFETPAMKRGKYLENKIVAALRERNINMKKCGIFLSKNIPIFGASPDGINDTHILEIKSPFKDATIKNYIYKNEITPKCMAQLQLQMCLCRRNKGYFVVADPAFETTGILTVKEIVFDSKMCMELICNAEIFWSNCIFNKL